MSEDNEPYTVVVHYREKQFPYSFTSDIDSWDNETYLGLKRRVRQEFRLTGEFGLFEDIDGFEQVDIDDQDDLKDAFFDTLSEDDDDDELTTRKLLHCYVKDHEQLARLSWIIGSYCSIFSRSKNRWYDGKIEKIYGELQDEWIVVRYDKNRKTKEIQRNSKDIRPLSLDHPLSLQKGSYCSVYSDKTFNWYKGEIIEVFNDAEGEWLKVKYREEDSVQTAELQRFSSDLKSVSFLKKIYNGIGLGRKSIDDTIEIVIDDNKIENAVKMEEAQDEEEDAAIFNCAMAVDQTSIPFIVCCFMRRIEQSLSISNENESYVYHIVKLCLSYSRPCSMWMECAVGDRILLKDGKSGIVRYIGKAPSVAKELVGIELDDQCPNSNDMNLFTSPPGHSYFIERQTAGHLVNMLGEGNYAKIIGLNKVPSFNGKIVKLATFVEKKKRWKVKLATGSAQKKYLGVKQTNLQSIPVWHQLSYEISWNLKQSLRQTPNINDMVVTVNNKYGKVMHCNANQIGIKLSQYDVNGGDGSVNEMSYLNVPKGYGYFTDIKHLVAINPADDAAIAQNEINVKVGDYVVLDDTHDTKGIVTFCRHNIVGIERKNQHNENIEYIATRNMIRDIVMIEDMDDDLDEIIQRLNDARA